MIISGGSRNNWRFFSKHLMKTDENERVDVTEIRGLAGDTVLQGFREMDALAGGTRVKNFFYHANLNPREDEHLTPEQWDKAVDTLEKNLGLEGQSRMVVEHEKQARIHKHVIWSRIDPDSMTAISDSQNYAKHAATSRELEQEFGLAPVRGVLMEPDGPRPERRPKNWETFRGHKSGIDPQQVKAEVSELWHSSDNGKAFRTALAERGYVLCTGDRRDFCLIDPAGQEHSLGRRIAGVKAAELREGLADIDPATLPDVVEGRQERRKDKESVAGAITSGADRKRIESAINATRASEVAPVEPSEATADRENREAYEKAARRQSPEPPAEKKPRDKKHEMER